MPCMDPSGTWMQVPTLIYQTLERLECRALSKSRSNQTGLRLCCSVVRARACVCVCVFTRNSIVVITVMVRILVILIMMVIIRK